MTGDESARTPNVNTSALHAFDVLRLVARSDGPLGLMELARALDLPPSSLHRILVTLESSGYIDRDPRDSRVTLGVATHELRHALFDQFPLRRVSLPYLERLAGSAGETAALQVRVGWYSVRICGVEGPGTIHRALHLGEAFPLHVTAGGRAMLAAMDDEGVHAYIDRDLLTRVPAGLDLASLHKELSASRERGYALDLANLYPESRSIALPVRGPDGVVGSISITGSAEQFAPESDPDLVEGWRNVSAELEAHIGSNTELTVDPFGHVPSDEIEIEVTLPTL